MAKSKTDDIEFLEYAADALETEAAAREGTAFADTLREWAASQRLRAAGLRETATPGRQLDLFA
jgi:hypothetical protein